MRISQPLHVTRVPVQRPIPGSATGGLSLGSAAGTFVFLGTSGHGAAAMLVLALFGFFIFRHLPAALLPRGRLCARGAVDDRQRSRVGRGVHWTTGTLSGRGRRADARVVLASRPRLRDPLRLGCGDGARNAVAHQDGSARSHGAFRVRAARRRFPDARRRAAWGTRPAQDPRGKRQPMLGQHEEWRWARDSSGSTDRTDRCEDYAGRSRRRQSETRSSSTAVRQGPYGYLFGADGLLRPGGRGPPRRGCA